MEIYRSDVAVAVSADIHVRIGETEIFCAYFCFRPRFKLPDDLWQYPVFTHIGSTLVKLRFGLYHSD